MDKYKKSPKKKKKKITLKDKLTLVFFWGLPVGFVLFLLIKTGVGLILLQTHGTKTKALVTSSVVYTKIRSNPHYLYTFQYEGNHYEGNSLIEEKDIYRVGDSIDVLFLEFWPSMNRPTYYWGQKENKQTK